LRQLSQPLSQNGTRAGRPLLSADSIPHHNSRVPHVSLFLQTWDSTAACTINSQKAADKSVTTHEHFYEAHEGDARAYILFFPVLV
jgi:hypothetical protein